MGERCVRNAEVEGSTPFRSTCCKPCRNKSFCYLPTFGSAAFPQGAKPYIRFCSRSLGEPHIASTHRSLPQISEAWGQRPSGRHFRGSRLFSRTLREECATIDRPAPAKTVAQSFAGCCWLLTPRRVGAQTLRLLQRPTQFLSESPISNIGRLIVAPSPRRRLEKRRLRIGVRAAVV